MKLDLCCAFVPVLFHPSPVSVTATELRSW